MQKKERLELRYYDVPSTEFLIALYGDRWRRIYGDPNRRYEKHIHNIVEIGVCREGHGLMGLDNQVKDYEPGIITIIPPNYPHYTQSVPADTMGFWEYLFIDFERLIAALYPDDLIYQRSLIERINKQAQMMHSSEIPEIAEIIDKIFEEVKQQTELSKEKIRGYVIVLTIALIRLNEAEQAQVVKLEKKSGYDHLRPSIDYIEKNYAQDIRIADLASACHMSESHYRRLFVANMNMAPLDFVNRMRITKACALIKKNEYLIEDIAVKTGFSTISTFNRNFKKVTGMTPIQWKKTHDNYESRLADFSISVEKGW